MDYIGTINTPVIVRHGGGIDFTSWVFGDDSLLDFPEFSDVRKQVLNEITDAFMYVMTEEPVMFFELTDTVLDVSFCLNGDCLDGELSWEIPLGLVNSLLTDRIQELKDEIVSLRDQLKANSSAQGEK